MSYISQVLADGAVGFWELGEASGATATDATGNSNGTYNGSITYGIPGIPGGGGSTGAGPTTTNIANKVTIPDVAAQHVGDTFSMEVWIKRSATQGAIQRLFGTASGLGPDLEFTAGDLISFNKTSVNSVCTSSVALTDTANWHQILATKTGAAFHLYIDGVDVTVPVGNQTMSNTAGWMIFLTSPNNSPAPAGMGFAMASIYPTVLTPAQVLNHYNLGAAISFPATVLQSFPPLNRGRFA